MTHDAGSVTAEFALALPAVVAVLTVALTGAGVAMDQLQCTDAARVAARAAARGEPESVVQQVGSRHAPAQAEVLVRAHGTWWSVEVTAPQRGPQWLPVPRPHATATAYREDPGQLSPPRGLRHRTRTEVAR